MKRTAVEWLMDKLFDPTFDKGKQIDWFEQAKEMEKEQMRSASCPYICGLVLSFVNVLDVVFETI